MKWGVVVDRIKELLNQIGSLGIFAYMPNISISDVIEIIILTVMSYYLVKTVQGTRAWVIIKGVAILLVFYILAYLFHFSVIVALFESIILFIGIAIVIIMQQDIRKLIELIGSRDINFKIQAIISLLFKKKEEVAYRLTDNTIQELVKGCFVMSKAKTGALIVIEKNIPLGEYAESGIAINADITSQLLINIFEHNTPLHDGAVIIQNNRIIAATCYLPLSESKKINKDLGTRHRAGIGMTEETDALVIIVSEETGSVSVANSGKLKHNIDREVLAEELRSIQKISDKTGDKKRVTWLSNNLALKIASLLGSIAIWLLLITSINPVETITFRDIEVQLINTEALAEVGKTFELVGDNRVNVTIKDRRDILDKLSSDDILAIADMSKLSYVNSVPIEVTVNEYSDADIELSEQVIKISIEDIITTEFDIEINTLGEVNDKFYISSIELQNEALMITGAESVVSSIGRVEVVIDESKLTGNTVLELEPLIYDRNDKLLANSKFLLNNEKIKVNVCVYKVKKIPIHVTTDIRDSEVSKLVSTIDWQTKVITVAGPDEILDKYEYINIKVPLGLNMSDITTGQFIKNISIQNYLSDGLIVIPNNSKLSILVEFKSFIRREILINHTDIVIEGIQDGLEYIIETQDIIAAYLDINTNGNTVLEDIICYIDVTELGIGEHEVGVGFRGAGAAIFEDVKIKLTITNKDITADPVDSIILRGE